MEFLGQRKLALALIDDSRRLRPVDPAWATGLAELMAADGQNTPLLVQQASDNQPRRLIAGGHRLAAARLLGWDEIEVQEIACSDDEAALLEIDENLARRGLTVLEEAVFLAKRKRVYEQLHPETRHGGDRMGQVAILATRSARFTVATEEATGKSERTIQRRVTLGETLATQLPPELLQGLLASPHADDANGLEALRKAPQNERAKLVRAVLREKSPAPNLLAAIRPAAVNVPVDLDDQQFETLVSAWRRNPRAKARQRFREWLATPEAAKAGLG